MLLRKLHLIRLVHFLELRDRFVGSQLKAGNLQAGLDDFLHLSLDLLQILVGEGLLDVKIIIEAAFNRGADGAFGVGVQSLDSLRQNVGRGMPERVLAFLVVEGEKLYLAVLTDRGAQVADNAVDLCGTDGFIQSHTD